MADCRAERIAHHFTIQRRRRPISVPLRVAAGPQKTSLR
jgi:hypothetical protein